VLSHTRAFFIGTGFGCEETGNILKYMYNLDKPHAHNFVIEFWVELGVVGIILLGILLIWSAGKLLEINTNNSRKLTLVFCVFTSLVLYLGFGLSDFIFNSPKQMIFLFLLLGLTQSISYCYDKTVITDARTLERAARKEIRNTLNQ
jgi:O-antigen ligase